MWYLLSSALLAGCVLLALSGCGYTVSPGAAGSLLISTNKVQFGPVRVGETVAATVTATNSGSSTVQISNIDVSGKGFSAAGNSKLPVTLGRGDSYTAIVQFGPTDTGTLTGTLTVAEPSKTEEVALVGTGTTTPTAGALSSLNCTQNAISGPGTDTCTVGLSAAAGSGGLAVALSSNNAAIAVPSAVTVAAGATTAGFAATVASVSSSSTVTLTASAGGATQSYAIDVSAGQATAGTPSSPSSLGSLNSLSCSQNAMSGAGTDTCTVGLTGPAGSGGLAVALSSNNAAIAVPSAVTVAAGATTAGFAATVASVSSATTVTLTASAGGVTKSDGINLSAQTTAGTPALTLQSTSVAFGAVTLNSPATQAVVLRSSGTAAVTISRASLSGGPAFSIAGPSFPLTIPAGQTATLYLQFKPATAGAATGGATLVTNTSAGNATISLSGTGQAPASYQVALTWNAPKDRKDPVVSYKIYRAVSGSSVYQVLASSSDTTYNDTTVSSGTAYIYYVESVDDSGNQSAPSNTFVVGIP